MARLLWIHSQLSRAIANQDTLLVGLRWKVAPHVGNPGGVPPQIAGEDTLGDPEQQHPQEQAEQSDLDESAGVVGETGNCL
jgi:hypothetical protein